MLLKVSSNFNDLPVVSIVPLSPPPSRHDLVFLAVATGGEPEMEEDKNVMMVKAPKFHDKRAFSRARKKVINDCGRGLRLQGATAAVMLRSFVN